MKTYKPSNDIQILEWEKMKKRWEELWNERDPRSSYWKPTHAQQFARVALESTPTTLGKNTSLQVSMAVDDTHQAIYKADSIEIDDSRPATQNSPIRSPIPHMTDFLY